MGRCEVWRLRSHGLWTGEPTIPWKNTQVSESQVNHSGHSFCTKRHPQLRTDCILDLKRKMGGHPMVAYTSAALISVSFKVHLLQLAKFPCWMLYGKSMSSPDAMLELPHLILRCFSTEDIFFRAPKVSSRCGLCPSYNLYMIIKTVIVVNSFYCSQDCKWYENAWNSHFTFSNPRQVTSSTGNSWSLSFTRGGDVCPDSSVGVFEKPFSVSLHGGDSPEAARTVKDPEFSKLNFR